MVDESERGGRRNRRRVYGEDGCGPVMPSEGIPCARCGCRHSYVVRTEVVGGIIRRRRECRFCGQRFWTTESA